MADSADKIRALLAEVRDMPVQEPPAGVAWLARHPGIVRYESKTPIQYRADQRRAAFLRGLQREFPTAHSRQDLPPRVLGDFIEARSGEIGRLESPYQDRLLTTRNPVLVGAQWMQSLPAMAYHAGEMLGNQTDRAMSAALDMKPVTQNKNAARNFGAAINTFTEPVVPFDVAGNQSLGRAYANELDQRAAGLYGDYQSYLDNLEERDALASMSAERRMRTEDEILPSGGMFLRRHGAPEPVANVGGLIMDAMLDPFPAGVGAFRAARAGRPGALKMLAADYALPVGLPLTVQGGANAYERLR